MVKSIMLGSHKLSSRIRKLFIGTAVSAALISLTAVTAPAATIHVPANRSTIQQAIDAANNGDFVLVSPGTSFERSITMGKPSQFKAQMDRRRPSLTAITQVPS